MNYSGGWGIVLQTICLLIILFLAPLENKNHKLDEDKRKKYGIKARIVEILVFFVYTFLYLSNKQHIMISVGMANIVTSVSLIAGYAKNRRFQ